MGIIYGILKELKNKFSEYSKRKPKKGIVDQHIAELENEIKQLKEQLEQLEQKVSLPIYTDAMPDWKNMDETIYPPELHLAMVMWQRIYQNNESNGKGFDGHSSKFKVIANDINLDPSSLLSKRIKSAITPAISKNDQEKLAGSLRTIKGLYMSEKKRKPI